ncbi:MAG: PEGA domain-containing protein [Nitrosomonadales bacterium]|nr:PEGA domain-containing protein [Nitrosomonadales bacterium]
MQRAVTAISLSLLAACSSVELPSVSNLIGSSGDSVSVSLERKLNANAPTTKFAASIRVARYTDARKGAEPRKIGVGAHNVSGLSGDVISVDQDVSTIVTRLMRNTLDDAGFQVDDENGKAIFELSGVVKELTLNVKARDEISVAVESTLKEVSTGKVVWSGMVIEKNDRFAGVSGNNRDDVAAYLKQGVKTVTGKTSDAISASLMASRPELFNLTAGTKPIPGVTVYVAPTAVPQAAPATYAPAVAMPGAAIPAPAYSPRASATSGLLLVNTTPGRAKVYLDGVYFGLSPLRLELEPGIHAISIKLEGYKMSTEKVSIRKGDNTEIELNLER